MTDSRITEHFTDTIFYRIELTAKYVKKLGQQVFEKINAGISVDEFAVLDTISYHKPECQRDLAKLILKDRANTGKLLDSLEGKNLITRELTIKNNRPVRSIKLTEAGINKLNEIADKVKLPFIKVRDRFNEDNIEEVVNMLAKLREILKEEVEIQI